MIKRDHEYKIAKFDANIIISSQQYDSLNLTIYNVRGTDDYYIRIWGITSEEVTIQDGHNTEFSIYYEDTANNKKIANALTAVPYSYGYYCLIDGNRVTFEHRGYSTGDGSVCGPSSRINSSFVLTNPSLDATMKRVMSYAKTGTKEK